MGQSHWKLKPMTQEQAGEIAGWRYDGVYACYNPDGDRFIQELMDGNYLACTDESGDLIGFFCFGGDARIQTIEEDVYPEGFLDIGLGMRPDLCGKGQGPRFMDCGLRYARRKYSGKSLRLSVAAFNRRAVRVYQKAGFSVSRSVMQKGSRTPFYIMVLE